MQYILAYFVILLVAESCGYPELLFANRKDIRVVDIHRGKLSKNILVKDVDDASSVDYYYKKQVVCWTDIDNEFIKCVSLSKTKDKSADYKKVKVISRGVTSPDGMALDWLTEKIYWADSETDRIEVAELYGSERKLLYWTELDQPRGIALVPSEGIMFWSDWGEKPKIERAGMNGDPITRKVIIKDNIYWPNGLTVDYENRVIFWADGKHSFISSTDYDGKRRVKVFEQIPYPFAVTFFEHTLYWTDWHTKGIHYCHINEKRKCDVQEKLSMKLTPMYIHVYDQSRQKYTNTPCHLNNGGCSNLCLLAPSPQNYSCGCSTGVNLKDEFNCEKGPKEMLLLARRLDIRRISLDTPDRTAVVLPVSNVFYAIAVDYDPVEEFFYWTDDKAFWIQRARLNGSDQQTLIHSEGLHLDGVAIDWLARNLYWSDIGNNLIEAARIDGTSRKIILMGELDKPRAIAIYPEGGLMFWSDWGRSPKIERANLDGSDRRTIVNTNIEWPNGVAIDFQSQKVYWVDAYTHAIEVAEFDGSNRRVILEDNLSHAFGFSLLGDYLYWTDWQKRSIERVHKDNGTLREILVDQLPNVMGLKAVAQEQDLGKSPCKDDNGGCSHLCFNRPNNDYVCDCPLRYEISSDGRQCIVPDAFLLYSHNEGIRRISLSTEKDTSFPVPRVKEASAIEFDSGDFSLYWADVSTKAILRASTNGSRPETLVEVGLDYPGDLALDWVSKNLYWTDMSKNRIWVSRLDGSSKKAVLWNISQPKSIAVDPLKGRIYWSEWTNGKRRIFRSYMDGTHPQPIIYEDLGRVSGLLVDFESVQLYWIDVDLRRIERSSYEGHDRKVIVKDLEESNGLALFGGYLYWSDWENKVIHVADKNSGVVKKTIKTYSKYINDLVIFHSTRPFGSNPCDQYNGGCSHLCLQVPSPGLSQALSHQCACPTHFTLNDDGYSCSPPTSFLLFSQKSVVTRLVVDDADAECPTEVLPLANVKNVRALAFDSLHGDVYWINERPRTIRKADHDGSAPRVFIKDDRIEPVDLAVDSGIQLVFWSCSVTRAIVAAKTNGTVIGNIMSGAGDDAPQSLAVHSKKGLLFFVNGISPPVIERISLSGLVREVLITKDLRNPFGLAVDSSKDRLYWIDKDPFTIEMASLDGSHRKSLITSRLLNPVSLAIHGVFIYWVDSEGNFVERADKITGQERKRVLEGVPNLSDILAVNPTYLEAATSHPCHESRLKCSHYCIVDPYKKHLGQGASKFIPLGDFSSHLSGFSSSSAPEEIVHCECPHGMSLARDQRTCVPKPDCPPNHFTCLTGMQDCVPIKGRCDGLKECTDGSDELNCPTAICGKSFFRCTNGQCIDNSLVCDRISQCSDASDETECCPRGQAMCKASGQCTHCSNVDQCPDIANQCQFSVAEIPPSPPSASSTIIILAVFVCLAVLILAAVFVVRCRRKPSLLDEHHPSLKMNQTRTRTVLPGGKMYTGVRDSSNGAHLNHHPLLMNGIAGQNVGPGPGVEQRPDVVNIPQGRNILLDRAQVTGASSSSSSLTHYPRETLNPPPTPVSDPRGPQCRESRCCYPIHPASRPVTINSYRHYKLNNRPPPPTPCSTDVCDDSDFNSSVASPTCLSPTSTCYSDYDSEPCAPPSTPYRLCDLVPSSPSPSTDRSCFIDAPCPSPMSLNNSE